ncbi:hypothetical protein [Streptomyces plumbiresistens]|uniref:hypothetical protein n=1 Tax=Streptomyces plumbiresistens TaxID=511811 RepID=UPI0031F07326
MDHQNDARAVDPARSAARAQWEAQLAADEAELLRAEEWHAISRRLDRCHAAQRAGDNSTYLRDRVARLEALQACLLGSVESLAA